VSQKKSVNPDWTSEGQTIQKWEVVLLCGPHFIDDAGQPAAAG
jgi:hypothetical protein